MILVGFLVFAGISLLLLSNILGIEVAHPIITHLIRDIGIAFLVAAIIDSSSARLTRKSIDALLRHKTERLLQRLSEDNAALLNRLSEGFDESFTKILMLLSGGHEVSKNTQAAIKKTLESPLARNKFFVDLEIIKCDKHSTVIEYMVETEVLNFSRHRTLEYLLRIGVEQHPREVAKTRLVALEINGEEIDLESLAPIDMKEQLIDYSEYEATHTLRPGDALKYKFVVEEEHFFDRFEIRFTTLLISYGFLAHVRGQPQHNLFIRPALMGSGRIERKENLHNVTEFKYEGGCLLPHQGIALQFTKKKTALQKTGKSFALEKMKHQQTKRDSAETTL